LTGDVPDIRPRIEKLAKSHVIEAFDCGSEPLNAYLKRFALANQSAGAAQTYVGAIDDRVVGYYSLSAASVEYADAPERLRKGLARHPIPVMLLARLAVHVSWQGKGLGAAMLLDALRRTMTAADILGIRAVMVHAKDEGARRFYEHFNFDESPIEPLHMFLLLKEVTWLLNA
jgi:GNAT superfamily N-acetyltransferase